MTAETRMEQLIRRCRRQDWLTFAEAHALASAVEIANDANSEFGDASEFVSRYGKRAAETLKRMMGPVEETKTEEPTQ